MADQKISEMTEVTSLADDDWITAVDVSNTSTSPTGQNVKIQKSNLVAGGTVVQAASIQADGTVLSEIGMTGLNVVKGGNGFYSLTFPDSATGIDEQSISITCGDKAAAGPVYVGSYYSLTVNSFGVRIKDINNTDTDFDFNIIRVM